MGLPLIFDKIDVDDYLITYSNINVFCSAKLIATVRAQLHYFSGQKCCPTGVIG